MDLHKGKICLFVGHHLSGLGHLVIEDEKRGRIMVPCDNAPTVRALDGCFGDVIAPGHSVNNHAIAGKEVYYSTDFLGMLECFTPVDDAPPEMVRIYENE